MPNQHRILGKLGNHGRRPHVVVRGSNLGIADLWSRQQAKNFVGLQTSNANPSSGSVLVGNFGLEGGWQCRGQPKRH
ncbi:hypothetical protein HCBG_02683 [Histoplasma capsulatum G186AR]|uniref:Uncharacterized protein n=1 Tax=Ajellomyces capsulatus (strain G186AR / H82 / ATCC MYA-2454 / RMSCC 2432) TaxID=447093 RepID=C0NH61_AJECG|nr:uncharacterized protein HCBG_02683 [Histoplasma capsulatum G186AR]EEH09146.1 hypothetical protein HCBG_02683 [Histoplasma capsulatum G186AR]